MRRDIRRSVYYHAHFHQFSVCVNGTVRRNRRDALGILMVILNPLFRQKNIGMKSRIYLVICITGIVLCRIFILELFYVPSNSMEDTLFEGDYLLVYKFPYRSLFSFQRGKNLPNEPQRAGTVNHVQRGDILVFHAPWESSSTWFRRKNFVKRCIGLPGDTLMGKNSILYVNGQRTDQFDCIKDEYFLYSDARIAPDVFAHSNIHIHSQVYGRKGCEHNRSKEKYFVYRIAATGKSIHHLKEKNRDIVHISPAICDREKKFQQLGIIPELNWTAENFGPIVIPQKGMHIQLDKKNKALYRSLLQQYEGVSYDLSCEEKSPDTIHVFSQNYYLMLGDNRPQSKDSRAWGFLPHQSVIGNVVHVFSSQHSRASLLNE